VTEPVLMIAAAGLHMLHRRLGHVEIAVEVGLQGAVEVLLGQVLEVEHVLLEGGVVDQDVRAAEARRCAPPRRLGVGRIGDVAGQQDGAAALGLDGGPW
jgi:hypothetical protein